MKRRALIIYCDDTDSGKLSGPIYDNANFRDFFLSNLGGKWYENEILSLNNPSSLRVSKAVNGFLFGADYSLIIYTGHGYINTDVNRQYIELFDKDIPIVKLKTTAKRQTLIVDACRGFYSPTEELIKGFSEVYDHFIGDIYSTRQIYDNAILKAEEGWTILFAASENQTALDTDRGGAYLLSLLRIAEIWAKRNKQSSILDLRKTHGYAKNYLSENFNTIQMPTMNREKRIRYFPFAVKAAMLDG